MAKENKFQSLYELVPHSEEAIRVLKERAKHLAISTVETKESGDLQHYVHFKLGNTEHYGIPFQNIKEVLLSVNATPVPNTPSWIAGLINRQGSLLAIIDLKPFFDIKATQSIDTQGHLIVIQHNGIICAILVDSIVGSDAYDPKNLDSALISDTAINPKYITGLHQGMVAILNIETLLPDLKFNQSKENKK